jgi:uncharacterized protein (TIGR00369 family)
MEIPGQNAQTAEEKSRLEKITGPHQIEMESWISCAPYEQLLHMEIVEALDGKAILTMPFMVDYAQGAGLMHGGALISLADTALVMAIKSILPPYTHFATTHVQARYLKGVKQGIVTAQAKLTGRKDRVIIGEVSLYNDSEEQVLDFTAQFKIARDAKLKQVTFADDHN